MKNPTVGVELLRADRQTDGQTDMTKLIVVFFRNFTKARKKEKYSCVSVALFW
jgi:hypothetical protein